MNRLEQMDRGAARTLEGEPKKTIVRVLVIEDQRAPLRNIEDALNREASYTVAWDVARWYTQAEDMIRSGRGYDVILLDHRMPYGKPDCAEDEDYRHFCAQLQNIGYGLVPVIKGCLPNAVVVGTSSLSHDEIRTQGYSVPEKTISKIEAWNEIPLIIAEIAMR